MKKAFFCNCLSLRFCVFILALSMVALPLAPLSAAAADEQRILSKPLEKVDKNKAATPAASKNSAASDAEDAPAAAAGVDKQTPKKPVKAQPAQQPDEGLSTLAKVGIGVGAVAVVGGVVALAAGGSGGSSNSSSSSAPSSAKLVGQWDANASNDEYGLTFTGIFNLYDIGSYTYDYLVSDGMHEQGTGNWTLDGNRLTTVSDTGSTFVGDFQGGNFTTITMHHTVLQWVLNLTKQ
jgi:hypothetical protein